MGLIDGAIPLNQQTDGLSGPLGGDGLSGSWGGSLGRDPGTWESGGVGPEERVWIMAEHRHAGSVLALVVDGDAGQVGVMVVDGSPGDRKQALVQRALHPGEDADAATGKGGVDKEAIRVLADFQENIIETLVGDTVDVHQDETCIAGDVRRGPSTLEGDRGDDGRLVLLEQDLLGLEPLDGGLVVRPLRLLKGEESFPIALGHFEMLVASQFFDHVFPCDGRRGLRTQ